MFSIIGIILTLISVFIFIGLIFLQIFLAKKPGRWPGLILPIFSFALSIIIIFNTIKIAGVWQPALQVAFTAIIANIPTIVFLVIYFVCREKYKQKAQIDKMNVQDLN